MMKNRFLSSLIHHMILVLGTVLMVHDLSAQVDPLRVVNIVDFGAKADGVSLNSEAIQLAINEVSVQGGGRVDIPMGRFLTGSVVMKSGVTLYLHKGAQLLGSTDPQQYFKMDFAGRPESPKKDDNSQMALILAHKANHIGIAGEGTIDGQGLQLALAIDSLHHAGIAVDPKYNERRHRPAETQRPKLLRFSQCTDVKLIDFTAKNAACWGLSFELCERLEIERLTVVNRAYWNNDGMDITDCTDVRIAHCNIDAADDGICLKSYYPGYQNDRISIIDCEIRSSASAVKFGSASYGGFKNIEINAIRVFDTFRSAIAIESVDGAEIENVTVDGVKAVNTGNAFFIRLGHRDGDKPGYVRNVVLKNIDVQVPFGRPDVDYDLRGPEVNYFHNPFPASIVGLPHQSIESVKLENITLRMPGRASKSMAYIPLSRLSQVPEEVSGYPEFTMFGELPSWGIYARHVEKLLLENVHLEVAEADFRPALIFDDVDQVHLKAVEVKPATLHQKQIVLYQSDLIDASQVKIIGLDQAGIFELE